MHTPSITPILYIVVIGQWVQHSLNFKPLKSRYNMANTNTANVTPMLGKTTMPGRLNLSSQATQLAVVLAHQGYIAPQQLAVLHGSSAQYIAGWFNGVAKNAGGRGKNYGLGAVTLYGTKGVWGIQLANKANKTPQPQGVLNALVAYNGSMYQLALTKVIAMAHTTPSNTPSGSTSKRTSKPRGSSKKGSTTQQVTPPSTPSVPPVTFNTAGEPLPVS